MSEPQTWTPAATATAAPPRAADVPVAPEAPPVDVSVCIVSYKVKDLLRDCLRSLKENAGDVRYETIVVHNVPSDGTPDDGTPDMIRAEFPWVTLVEPHANLGFGRANNLAYKHSRGRWVLLLNPDTVVLDRAIEKLHRFAQTRADAGAVGGRTLQRDGASLERSCCWGSPGLWPLFCKSLGLHLIFKRSPLFNREAMDYWQRDSVREVGVITGCFLMIRRPVYEQTGGFDESFFMYAEETDLCWRIKQTGGKLVFTPDAQIIHLVGESARKVSSNRLLHINCALLKLFRKHHGRAHMVLANFLMWAFYANRLPFLGLAALFGGAPRRDKFKAYWATMLGHVKLFFPGSRHLIDKA